MDGATLSAVVGFFSALVVIGIPLLGFLYRLDKSVRRALSLLTGKDDVQGDGVLARLRRVEERVVALVAAVEDADGVEYERPEFAESEG